MIILKMIYIILKLDYNDLFNNLYDNIDTLIDIIYDPKDKKNIKFIIEYLFNTCNLFYENYDIYSHYFKLYGSILNENTKIEEILLLYFEKKLFDEKKYKINEISKFILFILQNKFPSIKRFENKEKYDENLLILLNCEYYYQTKYINIKFDKIKELGKLINKNYNIKNN